MDGRKDEDVIIDLPAVLSPERERRLVEAVVHIYSHRAVTPAPDTDPRR